MKNAFIASSESEQEEIIVLMSMREIVYEILGMELDIDQMPVIAPTLKQCRKMLHIIITKHKKSFDPILQ